MATPKDMAASNGQHTEQPASTPVVEPPLSHTELLALLNTLLEAERAGAKVLAVFLDEYEDDRDAWAELKRVQRDEASNCAILMNLISGLGAAPSKATGDFVAKALAVQGRAERLAFLNRGQGWVARAIRINLPRITDRTIHAALAEMHDSHRANIEACAALLETMSGSSSA